MLILRFGSMLNDKGGPEGMLSKLVMEKNKEARYATHLPFTPGEKIVYGLLRVLFGAASRLPFKILYGISDFMAWLADDVVHYRRKVVEQNLRTALPTLSDKEVGEVRRKFYRFLTDYFVETVKMGNMSAERMERHMRFENLDEVSNRLLAGQNVTLLLGHYCNWEWVSSLPLHFPKNVECGQIYHVLHNRAADKMFLRLRSHYGATSIPMEETLRRLIKWQREGKASVVGYIADQSPKPNSIHYWLDFLHHDTPVFTGPERISRKLRCAVYYLDMRREKRGYYIGRFVKISEDASQEPENRITEEYFSMLQQTIEKCPPYWLWSHRRWKRTRTQK